ncbi:MAG: MotA/TolQ/ExbB proton channel family protein [Pirellulales bacterium]|nr:MotA/TolQ/ExbB proton channel family protein [Pirellulales bacterium]
MKSRRISRWCVFGGMCLGVVMLSISVSKLHAANETEPAGDASPVGKATSAAAEAGSNAAAIAERNLIHIVRQGGPLMVPILICSFILVLFTFERLLSLRRGRVIPRPFVRRFLHQLQERSIDREEALTLCQDNGSPVAQVFAGAVQKWGRPAVEVEQGIIDAGERVSNGLRRYLRLLNGVATVSPLLGLLGTVLGMIQAFNDIATADAMGKPELLAAGIGQALITTASGLTVAIPALIVYMFFLSRVDRLVMDIDALSQKVVSEVSAESREARAKKTKAA